MKKFLLPLVAPIASIALLVISVAPFISFISVHLEAVGVSKTIIGIIHSSFYAGFLLGSIYADRVIKRVGYIRSFAALASLYAGTVLCQGMVEQHIVWILARFIGGFCVAALYVIIESWLLIQSEVHNRGKVLAIYMITMYAGQAFSQLLMQIFPPLSILPYLLTGVIAAMSVLPVSLMRIQSPEASDDHGVKIKVLTIYKKAPFGFLGCFIAGCILSSIYSFIPNFAYDMKFSVAIIMFLTIGGGFILQWPIGHLSDLLDRRKVLLGVTFLILVPSIFVFFLASYMHFVFICSFLLGGLCFTLYPLSITQVCDRFESHQISYVIGMLSLVFGIGAILGPIVSSLFMTAFTAKAVYLYIGGVASIFGLSGVFFIYKRPKPTPEAEKSDYVTLSISSPVAAELDPRAIVENPHYKHEKKPDDKEE